MQFSSLPRRRLVHAALSWAAGSALWPVAQAQTQTNFWGLLRMGGCVVLMRHAQTEPGIGDPPQFKLGDCSTQRNLSNAGREQAQRVGQAFSREGIRVDEVRSSAWCRCTDTADLAFGRHTVWAPVNSFFRDSGGPEQTRTVLRAVVSLPAPRNLVLVTHQVNISALTGEYPAMGEIFVTRPSPGGDRLTVLARQLV
ncbi:MAG: histidine phosphatase family protein [Hydrogenophaga sp.]|uniref:histidine phosphatase family protein n=1 Tax=Hydrogenophaga sp. TaxID=1904254 RepID=UPI00276ED433|nr:histidine phosphatase family protein [Hydrogenophaga sp.]MDP2418770.1 histidine phosphatase family protein [Hydrogenophaga sp.]MDZ4188046.1 histidine phosphatase family protein [Hydrogenophaga sp.]